MTVAVGRDRVTPIAHSDSTGIIDEMTERTAHDAGAMACPFVAFVDDRDERADVPDHRHRCYAEIRPAQRAIAHQQTFCLSPGFSACPTFQDWAKRESARARAAATAGRPTGDEPTEDEPTAQPADPRASPAGSVDLGSADAVDGPSLPGDGAEPPPDDDPFDDRASRNPHRDWAAPPPWVDPAGPDVDRSAEAPPFLTERSPGPDPDLAGGPAGLSASRWLQDVPPPRPDEAGNVVPERDPDDEVERALAEDRANRERAAAVGTAAVVGATASGSRAARRSAASVSPPKVSQARRKPVDREIGGPSWERPRRNEAYPTLKTRIGLPSVPRVVLAGLALVVAAIILFSLPFVLHLGGDGGSGSASSPSPSSGAPSASVAPTDKPSPTAKVYVVKSGDTLLKIAKRFGITVDQLIAANKQIKNPDRIGVGSELKIPVAAASGVIEDSSVGPGSATPASAAP